MESILQPQSDTIGSRRKVLVLGGMGGIGKTQLAISYAKRHQTHYTSVFWLNATSEVSLKTSLRNIAFRVLPPGTVSQLDDEQTFVHVSNWLSEYDNARWLLIFDNYDDPDLYSLRKYFPSVAHGSVIVTTRQPNRVNGKEVRVRSMSKEEDSIRVLATRSGRDNVETDLDARLLAQRFDGHPLALATAGAFLSQSSVSFGQYLQQYNARWRVIDSVEELTDYPARTLYSTWSLSFTQIEQQSPRSAHLLRFLAYLDHQDVWFQLFRRRQGDNQPAWFTEVAGDEFMFEDAMRVLTRYCLVEVHYQTGSYSLHACVHDWTLDGLNRQIDEGRYWLAFDCVASHIGVNDWDQLSTIRYRRFTRHAKRLLHSRFRAAANQNESVPARLYGMADLAELLSQQVQYNAAEQMYLRALAGCEKALGVHHPSTLNTVNNLGRLYAKQGKLAEAENMYLRALHGYEEAPGLDNEWTLDIVDNLGKLYTDQDKLAEAEKMYIRALQGYEAALGPDHISTLDTVNNLGILYANQGKLAKAEEMYLRALHGYEKTPGSNCISTLNTVNNLGTLYANQDKPTEAEKMYLRALHGKEVILGPNYTSTLDTVSNLGSLYADQGKLVEAEKMYTRALQGYEEALGVELVSSYLPALSTMLASGDLYSQTDRKNEAKAAYTQALSGFTAVQGASSKWCTIIEGRLQGLQLSPAKTGT